MSRPLFLLITLLIPGVMVLLGLAFWNSDPGKPNPATGYRTRRAMKSLESWAFAQKFSGRFWALTGGLLTVGAVLFSRICKQTDSTIMLAVLTVELLVLLLVLPVTEQQLKKRFPDE